MKKLMIIIITLLTATVSMAQMTAEHRDFVADMMGESMATEDATCKVYAMGQDNKLLMIDWPDLDSFLTVKFFLLGMATEEDAFDSIFDTFEFKYLCFKQIDKCYTKEDINKILKL
jgi:hypothetical protein